MVEAPPNGLGISGGALIDRYRCRADADFQKSDDLVGAERRPLHARVGPQSRDIGQSDCILRSSATSSSKFTTRTVFIHMHGVAMTQRLIPLGVGIIKGSFVPHTSFFHHACRRTISCFAGRKDTLGS